MYCILGILILVNNNKDVFQSITYLWEQVYNILVQKVQFESNFRFNTLFDLRQILLITFDFSIKPGSICLLKPQDKSKKFTNFESFLILGGEVGGWKYAKTWSLPKANFQVGYMYLLDAPRLALLYTLHFTLYRLYTIQTLQYTALMKHFV